MNKKERFKLLQLFQDRKIIRYSRAQQGEVILYLPSICFQYAGTVEGVQTRIESGPSDYLGTAGDGTEIHDRFDVQRLYFQLRIRRIHEVSRKFVAG